MAVQNFVSRWVVRYVWRIEQRKRSEIQRDNYTYLVYLCVSNREWIRILGIVFMTGVYDQRYIHIGSEFSRHPEGLSFWVWVFETSRGSEFFGSEFSRHPEGLSFLGLRSEFSRSQFSSHPLKPDQISFEASFSKCSMRWSLILFSFGSTDCILVLTIFQYWKNSPKNERQFYNYKIFCRSSAPIVYFH